MVLYIDVGNRSMYDASIQNTQRRYIQTSQKQLRLKWVVLIALSSFISRPIHFACERHSVPSLSILSLHYIKFFIYYFFGANCSLQMGKNKNFLVREKLWKFFSQFYYLSLTMSYAFYVKAIWFMIIDTMLMAEIYLILMIVQLVSIFNSFFLWE